MLKTFESTFFVLFCIYCYTNICLIVKICSNKINHNIFILFSYTKIMSVDRNMKLERTVKTSVDSSFTDSVLAVLANLLT